ncbi:MAG: [protein-PII] uridylyltransferase [Candidatus Nanopelagicales bacterium]|nr:[protein-PII] uridylyltransferase [Candidatus Nanopelagicales bacterium]MCU0295544.1 [protein-PII] uridylyltransferase [Candidatus Nanopelagicales bacterium]MCU0298366.1 [protein-PII] uridylyltransferase [Candidatus Nanopelagicales bacterium]
MSVLANDFSAARADLVSRPGFGPSRRHALAGLTDDWLTDLFDAAGAKALGCTLVAVGGYGRGEMAPASDIDVLLLHPSAADPAQVAAVAEKIWYPIWDTGIRLDHSVRTPAQARRLAGQDLRVVLGLLDARTVAGDDRLTVETRSSVLGDWRAMAKQRLDELQASVEERTSLHGELAYLLEPDLKESYGGLRDLTVLRALAASWIISPPQNSLAAAKATLLDARDALHLVTGRATDRLTQQEQPQVASMLGYTDEDELLRAVCAAGRTIAFVSSMAWGRVRRQTTRKSLPRLRRVRRTTDRAPLADGVVVQDAEVVLAADARPDRDPVLVLRAAAAAAQVGLRLSTHTVDRLANECAPLPVPWPRQARESLVSLLGAGRPTLSVWEALDQADLVSRLIPGWEVVRSAPQRNPVHRFTVDRHLVETAVAASAHARKVPRPDLLLVGALLHDIGKGRPGDHTDVGVQLVADLGPHLGFDAADTQVLVQLVRHHLLLPDVATRKDVDDPAVIEAVAEAVGTSETLDLLRWLTVSDAAATGPAAWSAWKANLVDVLVRRTHAVLAGDEVVIEPALEDVGEHLWSGTDVEVDIEPLGETELIVTVAARDSLGLLSRCAGALAINRLSVRDAASRTQGSRAVTRWTVQTQFGEPPASDRLTSDLRRAIAGELDLARRLSERERAYASADEDRPEPFIEVMADASSRTTVLEVRAHDRAGLLYWVTAALAAAGFNVDGAKVSTLGSEVVDVFFLTDEAGDPLSASRALAARTAVQQALAD